ncbi:DUF4062 domain-containing protein [Paenibacillus sp. FSL K6-1558]|uniref:DUF4062 domain-containing protein n=1 Tax=Paenibacillus sp. FSL K6-1558 TaxID=2921473 RepID=UPI0030F9FE9B
MKKKLQVFVSSTFTDLIEERQRAVESILKAGHIPAGMELFTAGDKEQWAVIKNWIEESDILLLILGGRYGSLEPESGKSYTQLEYEYALTKGIPVFAVVLTDQFLANKKSAKININVYEKDYKEKYEQFKSLVRNKMVVFPENIDQIATAITLSINQFLSKDSTEYKFKGWIRGGDESVVEKTLNFDSNHSRKVNEDQPFIVFHASAKNRKYGKIWNELLEGDYNDNFLRSNLSRSTITRLVNAKQKGTLGEQLVIGLYYDDDENPMDGVIIKLTNFSDNSPHGVEFSFEFVESTALPSGLILHILGGNYQHSRFVSVKNKEQQFIVYVSETWESIKNKCNAQYDWYKVTKAREKVFNDFNRNRY